MVSPPNLRLLLLGPVTDPTEGAVVPQSEQGGHLFYDLLLVPALARQTGGEVEAGQRCRGVLPQPGQVLLVRVASTFLLLKANIILYLRTEP